MVEQIQTRASWRIFLFFASFLLLGLLLFTWTLARATGAAPVADMGVANVDTQAGGTPNCRYGVSVGPENQNPFLAALGMGWAITFNASPERTMPAGVENVPMIRMRQDTDSQGNRLPSYTIFNTPLTDAPGGLGPLLATYPGRVWIVGNEVDREYWQDDMEPYIYARAYHDVHTFIKERDPSAQVAMAGLVQVTPNRLEYLDLVWESYLDQYGTAMPVDVWTMHIYVLPEARLTNQGQIVGSSAAIAIGTSCYEDRNVTSCADIKWQSDGTPTLCPQGNVYCFAEHDEMGTFIQHTVAMRQWMKAHGQQHKPLWLTEFSLLYPFADYDNPDNPTTCFLMDEHQGCFTPARVNSFMQQSLDYLETAVDPNLGYELDGNRLVQRWLWYTMVVLDDSEAGSASRLVSVNANGDPVAFTSVGLMMQNEIAARPQAVNFLLTNATSKAVSNTAPVSITVDVLNNGNIPAATSYTVSFYRDAALTDLIDSVVVNGGLAGCTRWRETVTVQWDGLQEGLNLFWAAVSSSEDSQPEDNVTSGFVIVNPTQVFLPVMRR